MTLYECINYVASFTSEVSNDEHLQTMNHSKEGAFINYILVII